MTVEDAHEAKNHAIAVCNVSADLLSLADKIAECRRFVQETLQPPSAATDKARTDWLDAQLHLVMAEREVFESRALLLDSIGDEGSVTQ